MALVSFTPLVDGATATAAGVNTPLSTIYNDYNGNITNANISASAAIDFSKVSGGTATALIAGQSWTPTWTNVSGGTLNYAKYIQVGKLLFFRVKYTLAGAGVAGEVSFSLPVTLSSDYELETPIPGNAAFVDTGVANYPAQIVTGSTTTIRLRPINAASTNLTANAAASTTNPFTFGTGDVIWCSGVAEVA